MSKYKKSGGYNSESDFEEELAEIFGAGKDDGIDRILTNMSNLTIENTRKISSGATTNSKNMFSTSSDPRTQIPVLKKREGEEESKIDPAEIPEVPNQLVRKTKRTQEETTSIKVAKLDDSSKNTGHTRG